MSYLALRLSLRSLNIKQTIGTRAAAGYLRNRGVPIEDALFILVGRSL